MRNEQSRVWNSFCSFAAEVAAKDKSFLLVTITDGREEFKKLSAIPEGQRIHLSGQERCALLNAAGLAVGGKRPWIVGSVSAMVSRGYGTIRDAIAIPSLPVRMVAFDGGLSNGREGASKIIMEDIALMRSMPGVSVAVPSDASTFYGVAAEALESPGPVYIRLGQMTPPFPDASAQYMPGGGRILREGTDATVCACGTMVCQALKAAEILAQQGINAEVIDCYSLKPFPSRILLSSVRRTGCCVTAEEHGFIGGLYSAAVECLSQAYPVPVRSVAVEDKFVQSGTPDELMEYCGITWQEIVNAAAQVWALRRR
jgi:transketolase